MNEESNENNIPNIGDYNFCGNDTLTTDEIYLLKGVYSIKLSIDKSVYVNLYMYNKKQKVGSIYSVQKKQTKKLVEINENGYYFFGVEIKNEVNWNVDIKLEHIFE